MKTRLPGLTAIDIETERISFERNARFDPKLVTGLSIPQTPDESATYLQRIKRDAEALRRSQSIHAQVLHQLRSSPPPSLSAALAPLLAKMDWRDTFNW